MNKFIITYNDNEKFIGDSLKGDWKKIDVTKQINKLEYLLDNICFVLQGYKEYNHLLEYIALGQKGLNQIFLMGRKEEETDILVINLKNGKINQIQKPLYQEYGQQILDGWQKGVLNNPKMLFKKFDNNENLKDNK